MSEEETKRELPVFHHAGGPMAEPASMEAYLNRQGLVTIAVDGEPLLEMSPLIAKQLRAQLREAAMESFTELLKEDEDL
jgi:hypothetical protein